MQGQVPYVISAAGGHLSGWGNRAIMIGSSMSATAVPWILFVLTNWRQRVVQEPRRRKSINKRCFRHLADGDVQHHRPL